MKHIKLILVCGLTLALTGLATLLVAAGASRDTTAVVRSMQGNLQYKLPEGGDWKPLKVNQILSPGTILRSGPGAVAFLSVNRTTSTVQVKENTTMILTTMKQDGTDTSTALKLDGGTLLGSVRKVSANSDYKVVVPGGVAAIRGTDWQVTVTDNGNGNFSVTFTSVQGTVFCQAFLAQGAAPGQQSTANLTTGQSWTLTATTTTTAAGTVTTTTPPVTMTATALTALQSAVNILNTTVQVNTPPPGPGPGTGTGTGTGTGGTTPKVSPPLPPNTNPSQVG